MSDWNAPPSAPVPPAPQPAPGGQEWAGTAWAGAAHTAMLPRSPAQPEGQPDGPPDGEAPRRAPRMITVVMVAALVGALAGAGGAMVATGARDDAAQGGSATVPPAQRRMIGGDRGDDLDRVAQVAEAVLPSVVQIDVAGADGAGNGSGVIYRADGYIVTNNHVAASGRSLEVVLPDGTRLPARVIGTDPDNDLAVLKVERTGLPAIAVGDSTELHVGELAVAVGSPFGLESTVTAGVISALNRPIQVSGPGGTPVVLPNVIQTDAAINPGNSGGALVNGDAELIGINSAILTAGTAANAGVGFAIPVSTVVDIADDLIAQGFVEHAYLGVQGLSLTPELTERLDVDGGAYLQAIEPGAPADEAGLRPGDVIVSFDGEAIESMEELVLAVRKADVGATVEVTYIRDGERRTARITLVEKPR